MGSIRGKEVALDAVTATGASSGIDTGECVGGTIWYIRASSVTSGATIQIQSGYDRDSSSTTDWATIASVTVTANGLTVVNVEQPHRFMRVNISARTDGTYTVVKFGVMS